MSRWGTTATAVVAVAIVLLFLQSSSATAFPVRHERDFALRAPGDGPMAAGDLNRDGRVDLVVADTAAHALYVFLQGPREFGPQPNVTIPLPGEPRALALADMNGDGFVDIAVLGPDIVWVVAGHRDGTASLAYSIPAPGGIAFAVGEMSGDASWDLVLVTRDGIDVRFLRPWATEYPGAPDRNLSAPGGRAVAVADVDGDGRADIIIARPYEVSVYLQSAPGVLRKPMPAETTVAGARMWLEVHDVNGDGRADLAVLGSDADGANGTVQVILQDRLGSFAAGAAVAGPFAGPLALGDLTGDGQTDLILGQRNGHAVVLAQSAGGTFSTGALTLSFDSAGPPRGIRVGRFHADSWGDVAIRVPEWIYIFIQEDQPPQLARPIPSIYAVNEGALAAPLFDLRMFYADDHGALTFRVVYEERPADVSATVDAATFILRITARPGWHGRAAFAVSAWDGVVGHEPVVSNTFAVTVNAPPSFASVPWGEVRAGETFEYQPVVLDSYPADDVHTFRLIEGPRGMEVDPATGLVRWTPTAEASGPVSVSLRVADAFGGEARQAFTIVVFASSAPALPAHVLAASGAAALLAGLGAGALASENLKYLLVNAFLPLYTKIKREQVLDHFVRGQIYGYVLANPGEHYNAIKQALGLTNGSLAHHLKTLEREEFLKSRRFGLYRRFYPIHMRIPDDGYLTLNTIQRTIAELVKANPGITQKDIAGRLNLTPPTVNYHIGILQEHRVVHIVREGRATHCFVLQGAMP